MDASFFNLTIPLKGGNCQKSSAFKGKNFLFRSKFFSLRETSLKGIDTEKSKHDFNELVHLKKKKRAENLPSLPLILKPQLLFILVLLGPFHCQKK